MQPQDNDFPISQVQSNTSTPQVDPSDSGIILTSIPQPTAASAQADATDGQPAPVSAGTTFQPDTSPQPEWQQTAASDTSALYAKPEQGVEGTVPGTPQAAPQAAPDILGVPTESPIPNTIEPPASDPGLTAMNNDFEQASVPAPGVEAPSADPAIGQPAILPPLPAPAPLAVPPAEPALAPQLPPNEPVPFVPMPGPQQDLPVQPVSYSGLPGASDLGPAVASMDQPIQSSGMDPNLGGIDPLMANMETEMPQDSSAGSNKKIIFIIAGAIMGLVIIIIAIVVIASSGPKQSDVSDIPEVVETPPAEEPAVEAPTVSPPATPPEGYVTIDKQCYTFAIYDPNTVPADTVCSFEDATFGKFKTSKITVNTITDDYKNLDEFAAIVEPSITVLSKEIIKLDGSDAKQFIYKSTDGRTYSRVISLVLGKSYQQEGKAVTGTDIVTSYQEEFDKTVTKNILDTWRWK